MSTTSAGSGASSGDDGGQNDEGWGWFTRPSTRAPARTGHESAAHAETAQDGAGHEAGEAAPDDGVGHEGVGHEGARGEGAGQGGAVYDGLVHGRLGRGGPEGAAERGEMRPVPAVRAERTVPVDETTPPTTAPTAAALDPARPRPAGPAPGGPAALPPAGPAGGSDPVRPRDTELTRRTMEELEPRADAATAYFYALLFVEHPELRELFPASMDVQRDRLFRALLTAVRLADDLDLLSRYLGGLGRGHRKYGTRPEHYPAVGECLMAALAQYAPNSWDRETEAAWVRAYTAISQLMIDAAAEDEQHRPPWWDAEVVAHERRTHDIAVLTVRPEAPYPFQAGQYTSLETPWWPRVWRNYSFASAPRPDGLLTFHVKAIPAGWVSGALVHRARPGDVLRLGPPAGSMTLDHHSGDGLVCVGGGTGIAPIKALVEDVVAQGRARRVDVFYGARSGHDLYDLDTMLRLERANGWLSVRTVISDGPRPAGVEALMGQLPDAVREYGPWPARDGYLSGPPGMIRSGRDALLAAGLPAHRIRHDVFEEAADVPGRPGGTGGTGGAGGAGSGV